MTSVRPWDTAEYTLNKYQNEELMNRALNVTRQGLTLVAFSAQPELFCHRFVSETTLLIPIETLRLT